ncbi:heterodisulfide reductase-related iron-sulfur binding cluster [Polycladidibacter stylochi]|uniref:heterodisulfide reductase-related iron-sulfur binding cluster n=1 Tax=Polycladidibacter stylochi TaxID=1807766 RepID=UPI00082F18D9|nr:heterodisulfide reductase-related iron-sulfur binding cluster [Pseudovibrio stylochi]
MSLTNNQRKKTSPHTIGIFTTCSERLFRPSVIDAVRVLIDHKRFQINNAIDIGCCGLSDIKFSETEAALKNVQQVASRFTHTDYIITTSQYCQDTLYQGAKILAKNNPSQAQHYKTFARKIVGLCPFLMKNDMVLNSPCKNIRTKLAVLSLSSTPHLFGGVQPISLLFKSFDHVSVIDVPEVLAEHINFDNKSIPTPAMSKQQVKKYVRDLIASGAGLLVGEEISLLFEVASELKRQGSAIEVRHYAEVLAGKFDLPPLGARRKATVDKD